MYKLKRVSFRGITTVFLLLVLTRCAAPDKNLIEWPETGFVSWLPAPKWEDALLTGNGTIGAMVMGYPFEETIIVNHALIYLPNEKPLVPANMAPHLGEIRNLSFDGKWKEAAQLGVKVWQDAGYEGLKWTDPYVPAADLKFSMPASNISQYYRSVDFNTAEAGVFWNDEKGSYTRKAFASRADTVLVIQTKGSAPIDMEVTINKHPHSWNQNSFMSEVIKSVSTSSRPDNILHMHCVFGKPHDFSPLGYDVVMKVESNKGTINNDEGRIKVNDGHDVLILLKVKPYYKASDRDVDQLIADLSGIDNNYNDLLESHKKIHGELYKKVQLNLNPSDSEQHMFSETLVKKVREETSPGIIQRQFEAARYNILCASGINPPNLQGIWSGTWSPPWSSDFTHDGNVQVAVSHFLNGNMPELIKGYFDHHEKLLPHYRTNARQFYGFEGIHVPSHTSTHGYNNHFDETWTMEYWNGGAAWASSIFYDYYLYTLDTSFLKDRAFPFMNEALTFWENFLITDEKGMYISVPSYSPENNPLEHSWQNCINATMDFALLKELIRNWVDAAEIIGIDQNRILAKREMLDRIPSYEISSDGVIKEWQWPGFTDNQSHRHASHLYGLYEVPDKDIMESDALIKAAQETIHQRMKIRKQQQGGEMSFGMCLLGNAAVRIGDESTATEIVRYLSKYYWTNGMATTHNPGNLFNMDISGGFPSLITRMLVNSEPGKISVLPALPEDWKTGEIKGVLTRGNIEIQKLMWDESGGKIVLITGHDQDILMKFGISEIDEISINGKKAIATPANGIELKLNKDRALEVTWSYM